MDCLGRRAVYAESSISPLLNTLPRPAPPAQVRWHPGAQYLRAQLPELLRPWLFAEGSLTQRLIALSGNRFRVQVLAQGWQRPAAAEARLLGLAPTAQALIREVILFGGERPWVYARSILPASTLTGDLRRLRKLQNSSLGALLFTYPDLRRQPFEVACSQGLWGRRSRFELGRRALIVSEFFLPDFVEAVRAQPDARAVS